MPLLGPTISVFFLRPIRTWPNSEISFALIAVQTAALHEGSRTKGLPSGQRGADRAPDRRAGANSTRPPCRLSWRKQSRTNREARIRFGRGAAVRPAAARQGSSYPTSHTPRQEGRSRVDCPVSLRRLLQTRGRLARISLGKEKLYPKLHGPARWWDSAQAIGWLDRPPDYIDEH